MTTYNVEIKDTQLINGIEYTQAQLLQGLAQIRTQHNERTGESLTDAQWLQWAHLQNSSNWYEQNKEVPSVVLSPIAPVANWDGLVNQILGGVLYPIYNRLTEASFVNPATATIPQLANANNIAVAAGKIDQALQVAQIEEAVAASLQLLISTSDYRFMNNEKIAWNNTIASLNFSSKMHLD